MIAKIVPSLRSVNFLVETMVISKY